MLEVKDISVSYGRHRALEKVSVAVGKGEICVILGANGAGKSTLLKAIAGMVTPEAGGAISMNGKSITRMRPHKVVEEGIALVPEGRGIFADLSVAENLQLGAFATRARNHEAETLARVFTLFPRLAERRRQTVRTMSGGEQQMVAIGRALMSRPDILMLDEPSLGLSPLLTQELFRSLTEVAAGGVGILLVEQNARQSLKIAERGYLIENGHVTGENSASALMTDPAVVAAYLGGAASGRAAAPAPRRPRIMLPPSIRLPAGLEAMDRTLATLAERASRIQGAFVRALRREGATPSAFVGRYDPKAGNDPWLELTERQAGQDTAPPLARSGPATVSPEAHRLAMDAATLARRAGQRLATHVATQRLSAPRPSAFARPLVETAVPALIAGPAGDAPSSPRLPVVADLDLDVPRGLIGHNSAGLVPEDQEVEPPVANGGSEPAMVVAAAPQLTIGDLVARAASVQAAHIAARRKSLSAFVVPVSEILAEQRAEGASRHEEIDKET